MSLSMATRAGITSHTVPSVMANSLHSRSRSGSARRFDAPRSGGGWRIAALALFAGVFVAVRQGSIFTARPQNAELAWTRRTVIVPSMSRSGEASEQKPIFLDRLPLELTIELPVGSKAGTYELQLEMNHRAAVSTGGNAEIHNGTTAFTVRINLSGFEAGNYSMVIRQVPNDWNLYPVLVR